MCVQLTFIVFVNGVRHWMSIENKVPMVDQKTIANYFDNQLINSLVFK